MDDAEFRERMDRHMVRGDEVLREIRVEIGLTREEVALTREEVRMSREQRVRSDALMDRLNERFDRDAESHADLRVFIREMIVRMERSGQELAREMRDLREESRAQRNALLRLLDRFDGPEPGGAAGTA